MWQRKFGEIKYEKGEFADHANQEWRGGTVGLLQVIMGLLGHAGAQGTKKNTDQQRVAPKSGSNDVKLFSGIMEISSTGFIGSYRQSASGRWIVGWSDSDGKGHGGFRERGHGRYVLYDVHTKQIIVSGKLQRPNHGSVADNGTFILEDWHFGESLRSTLFAFSADGKELLKRKFNANMFNSGISSDGKWAICQTANNPDSNDGNCLTAIDLRASSELFSVTPMTGWADEYDFLDDGSRFTVIIKDIGRFSYDKSGNFLDSAVYEDACLDSNRFDIALFAAEARLKREECSADSAKRILDSVLRSREFGADNDASWKAMALKIQGSTLEILGREDEALMIYDEALTLNPKIGVKRRADALRKRLKQ